MQWIEKQRDHFLANWYGVNGKAYFLAVCLLYFSSFLIKRMLVIDGIAAFEVLESRGEMWIFDLFFGLQYLTVPFFLAWKFTLTAFVLWVGCFMFGYRITFGQLWKLVMIFELVFIIPEFLKILWFILIDTDPNYATVSNYYPLSLSNLVNLEAIDARWSYPLKALNLFEYMYWLLLTAGIFWLSNKKLRISALIVATSYVLIFLCWLIFYVIVYK